MDEEPDHFRTPGSGAAAARPGLGRTGGGSVRHLLRPVRCRVSAQRRRRPRRRSSPPDQEVPADRLGGGPGWGGAGAGRRSRGAGADRRVLAPAALRGDGSGLSGAARDLFRTAETRRHHRRVDHRGRIRAPRRGGSRRHRCRGQPLAVRPDDPAGAVPGAQQAPSRARPAGGSGHRPPPAASRNTVRISSTR